IALSVFAVVAGSVASLEKLFSHDDPAGVFSDGYTTVNGRLVEYGFWLGRHAWGIFKGGARAAHGTRFVLTLGFAVATALLPVVAIIAALKPSLAVHPVGLGVGAL